MRSDDFESEWDPHSILQVRKGATRAEVHRAWRRMQKMVHPDRGDTSERQMRTEASARVNQAWYRLRDKFKTNDRGGATGPPEPSGSAGNPRPRSETGRQRSRYARNRGGAKPGERTWTDEWRDQQEREKARERRAGRDEHARAHGPGPTDYGTSYGPGPDEPTAPGTITIVARTIMGILFFITAFLASMSLAWSMMDHGLRTGAWLTATEIVAPSAVMLLVVGLMFNRWVRNMAWMDGLLSLFTYSFFGTAAGTVLALAARFAPRFM